MARRKNRPEVLQVKFWLAERLREIRVEVFGERGGSEMARRLGVPVRTWYNYESGVTVPAEILLRFMELTHVEPSWLLTGDGSKYRDRRGSEDRLPLSSSRDDVASLLRTALSQLELGNPCARPATSPPREADSDARADSGPSSTRIWLGHRSDEKPSS